MGSICKQQQNENENQELKIQNDNATMKNSKQFELKENAKKNTETSNGTLQYNQGSTKQFSIRKDPLLGRFLDQSLSSSDSDEGVGEQQLKQQQPQVFTNFVTFQALPSQKTTKPKFEFLQDQFRNEMKNLQTLQQQNKQF